ncbi:MAG: hypothetical protein QOF58_2986 [Pseudonocardiales bacterium]|jgi:hypothetical protein|nr:hypothetical protein [Pseudonocardiales bacterium]
MTTGTSGAEVGYLPALTVAEVACVVPCPLCGEVAGVECAHVLSRCRATLRLQAEIQAEGRQ